MYDSLLCFFDYAQSIDMNKDAFAFSLSWFTSGFEHKAPHAVLINIVDLYDGPGTEHKGIARVMLDLCYPSVVSPSGVAG